MRKQIKKMLCMALAVLMVCFSCVTVVAAGTSEKGEIEIATATTSKGATAEVAISFNVNPGILGAKLKIAYDSDVLTLTGVEDQGLLGATYHNPSLTSNPYVLYWENPGATANITATGVVVKLTCAVAEGAANGEYPISATYEPQNTLNFDGEEVQFDIVNGAVVVADAVSEFTYVDMALDTDIAVGYYANVFPTHAGAKVRFDMGGDPIVVDGVPTGNGNEYLFTLSEIAPQRMGDNIKAELILGDEVLDTADNYSITKYCLNQLAKTPAQLGISAAKKAELDTLIADMLEYGAMAQLYRGYKTNMLANEGVTGAREYVELPEDDVGYICEPSTHATVKFTGMGVKFDYVNSIYVKFRAAGVEDSKVKVVMTSDDGYSATVTLADCIVVDEENSIYMFEIDPTVVTKYGVFYDINLQVANARGAFSTKQNLNMSVQSYICALQNQNAGGSLTPMAKLARALYNYGASATAYAEA
jgi:hypothetical protein